MGGIEGAHQGVAGHGAHSAMVWASSSHFCVSAEMPRECSATSFVLSGVVVSS